MKTDSQLQRDVLDELAFEPMVEHGQIGVMAKDGVVTLTGHVPNYAQKMAAERAAARVNGVKAIAEEIKVRFPSDPKTSDTEIAERILQLFRWDVTVPDERIQVRVENGWVTLSGDVEWNYQKKAAQTAAGRITGVKGVNNRVEIKGEPSPADVRERIMTAIKRQSALDANAISVSVAGHTVKLSGEVHGWNERRVAEQAAWSVPGVNRVEDEIAFA
ncbi:BON domain-containing protein [Sphingomonas cannabina]|uniref:BON domain-containing protein n=1 Tax=Sphingomonas cannabina TaxID=2899123 RepID=UPI001F2A1BB7|nr:BON domain-containing protein [Sphingomonas cannabina]UIJ46222.1 BON domain-containing protein [Sphingomonas cannabina]